MSGLILAVAFQEAVGGYASFPRPRFKTKTKPAPRIVCMSDGEAIGKLLLLDCAAGPWVCPLLQRSSLFVRKLKGGFLPAPFVLHRRIKGRFLIML